MSKERLFKGGEFLITDALPDEVFTPEDFTRDQRLIAKSAEEFYLGELAPKKEEIEVLNPELSKTLMKKLGELGFLGADMPEYARAQHEHEDGDDENLLVAPFHFSSSLDWG